MKQGIVDTGHQAAQGSDLRDMGDQQCEPYDYFRFLPEVFRLQCKEGQPRWNLVVSLSWGDGAGTLGGQGGWNSQAEYRRGEHCSESELGGALQSPPRVFGWGLISSCVQRNYLKPGKELLKGLERMFSAALAGMGTVRVAVSQNGKIL